MIKISIRYQNSQDPAKWLAESVDMTVSGPKTTWAWVDDINLATHINMGILPNPIGMFAVPHNVSIETKITDLGEYK